MNNILTESLQQSFDYWSWVDEDSRIECLPIWKKILSNNSEIIKNQTMWIDGVKQDTEKYVHQFLESWSKAIEAPDFESAKNSMQKWQKLWEETTDENVKIFVKVLEMVETYWKDMQNKSID